MFPWFRRLKLLSFVLLLPLLTFAMPPAAVWSCAHATQLVTLLTPASVAMPCRMAGKMPMACCRAVQNSHSPQRATLQQAPCKPILSAIAANVIVRLTPFSHFVPELDGFSYQWPVHPPVISGTLSERPLLRGPPNLPLAAFTLSYSHSLRAPPSA